MPYEDYTREQKIIYFAGIVDGEGHLGLHIFGKHRRPVIQLQMTDEKTVRKFADFFGLTVQECKAPSHVKMMVERGHKALFRTRAECQKAYPIIKELLPHLCTKYEDALRCLAYYDDRTCSVCGGKIPYTKNWSSVVCSDVCYGKYKNEYDRERRLKLKKEKLDSQLAHLHSLPKSVDVIQEEIRNLPSRV